MSLILAVALPGVLLAAALAIRSRDARVARGRREALQAAALLALETTALGAARGRVKVRGSVSAVGERLAAPVSGRPCVAYELIVLRRLGPLRLVAERVVRAVDFNVRDGSGRARVAAAEAKDLDLLLDADVRFRSGPAPADLSARFGDRPGLSYEEAVIEENEEVVVVGEAAILEDATGYRTATRELVLSAPLVIADHPRVL